MVVKTNLTRSDYIKGQFYFLPRMKSNWAITFILWAVIFFDLLNELGFSGDAVCKFCAFMASLIVSIAYTSIILLILIFLGMIVGLSMVGYYPGFLGEHEFSLKDEGLFETTTVNETLSKWASISSLTKTKKFIYIRIGHSFHLLPRNSFEDHKHFDEFWENLHNRWKASRNSVSR